MVLLQKGTLLLLLLRHVQDRTILKATNTKSLKRKKIRIDCSIGKKEAKKKQDAKTRPEAHSNPSSTGREESTLPADAFYFVVIICPLLETDFQKPTSSRSCSSRESSISHDACHSPSSRKQAPYVREHAHSRSKNSTAIIGSSRQAQQK